MLQLHPCCQAWKKNAEIQINKRWSSSYLVLNVGQTWSVWLEQQVLACILLSLFQLESKQLIFPSGELNVVEAEIQRSITFLNESTSVKKCLISSRSIFICWVNWCIRAPAQSHWSVSSAVLCCASAFNIFLTINYVHEERLCTAWHLPCSRLLGSL